MNKTDVIASRQDERRVTRRCDSSVDRRGVAIVLVLGFLSLLVISAVAFSINMRVERLGAANFRSSRTAEDAVAAGLARAMYIISTNAPYPRWDVLTSRGPAVRGAASSKVELMSRGASAYVPEWFLNMSAGAVVDGQVQAAGATIDRLQCDYVPLGDSGLRCAFMILNISDFLDANTVGGSNRFTGSSPAELQIKYLDEFGPPADQDKNLSKFVVARNQYKRYEDLTEVEALCMSGWDQRPEYLCAYSRFPAYTDVGFDVSGGADAVRARRNEGRKRFADILGSDINLGDSAFYNLVNYVDADSLPGRNPGVLDTRVQIERYRLVDSHPMLSEVYVRLRAQVVNGSPNKISNPYIQVRCETDYPFLYPPREPGYKLWVRVAPTNPCFDAFKLPAPEEATYKFDATEWAEDSGYGYFAAAWKLNLAGLTTTNPLPAVTSATFTVELKLKDSQDRVIDELDSPLVIDYTIRNGGGTFILDDHLVREAIDPRMNYTGGLCRTQWARANDTSSAVSSIGKINHATLAAIAANPNADRDLRMLIRNGALQTVGELGSIFYGVPLETIRLYRHGTGTNWHQVLDRFSVHSTGAVQAGMVNPNGRKLEPLKAAFRDMPMRELQGSGTASSYPLDAAAADQAARLLTNFTQRNYVTNITELGEQDWYAVLQATVSGGKILGLDAATNFFEADAEAFIRNSAGLMHSRQNLYLILLRGGSYGGTGVSDASRQHGSTVHMAEALAIAEVWCDPMANAEGKHTVRVHSFRRLGN